MEKLKEFFAYGEKVPGYDVRVLNEREARAAAAILFVGAFIGLTNGVMLGTAVFSKYFVTFFAIDFTLRVIQPRYAPSLLLGRFFVSNQTPEYVGAEQKRFAWALGMIIAWPMFYYLVLDFQPNPLKVLVCLICMALLFFEAAFSICLGCKIFNLVKKNKATHCPGGVCEMKIKEPIQTFNPVQKSILIITVIVMAYGAYAYMTKLPDRTNLTKKIKTMMLSDEELQRIEDEKADQEFEQDDF
ncbi:MULTISPECIES: DUF4395 domain-containing protein [Sulfurimonas]|uniref:DUF4395 domain-containing protein n=2 Tax=Sulfurimonadaceae TaxID=2771471 RepID=UPI00125F42E8|nr:DUF4395 domain-containing protein [Sulfurimonas hydrogeniphila]